jgi:hypothetical protein
MARPSDTKLHAVWRDCVRRQEASGLAIAYFRAQECVARSKPHAGKRRFRLMGPKYRPTSPTASAFLPVTVRLVEPAPVEAPPVEAAKHSVFARIARVL